MNGIGKTLMILELAKKLGIKMEEYTMKDRDKYLAKLYELAIKMKENKHE